jgi:hypothetical protein
MASKIASVFLGAFLMIAALAARPGAAAEGVSGEWAIQLEVEGQSVEYSLELTQTGDTVRGELVSPRTKNHYPIEGGSFKDSTLKFKVPQKNNAEVTARLSGDKLEGTLAIGDVSGKFIGRSKGAAPRDAGKKPSLPGKWRTTAKLPDGQELAGALEVAEKGGKMSGTVSSDRGSLDLKTVTLADGGKATLGFILPTGNGDLEVTIDATFDGADRLKGRWSLADGNTSGEWTAQREAPPKAPAKIALADRYRIETKIDGNAFVVDFRPRVSEEKLSGSITHPDGKKVEIQGSYREGRIEAELEVPYQGQTKRVRITLTVGEKGVLTGSWKTDDGSGDLIGRPVEEI